MADIIQYNPDMADALTACYNDLIANLPHCPPVNEKTFSNLKKLASAQCRDEALLVAREPHGQITGFVHLGIAIPTHDEPQLHGEPAVIRFLAYRPGHRHIGEALLQTAEQWAAHHECPEIVAWHWLYRYPFYHLPHSLLSERLAHIDALFRMGGYTEAWGELHLDWRDFIPPPIDKPAIDFTLLVGQQLRLPSGNPGLIARAMHYDREIGRCVMSRLRDWSQPDALSDWCYCELLSIDAPYRRSGLGKYLLAELLAEMHQQGCHHAAISVLADNHRAGLFYSNFGYTFCDRTAGYKK